ncbi:hypothetical protein NDU88_001574 [Pleurodeles waltl]|uniref:Uncharacterized protein n=1 Tax=Pleurodeles waltl TaxID=8319 RepID=A0AAV7R9H4_PLEWA|nr:hypothetical protein NDU88_001574 [Pleurodeles waltl]
MGGCRSGATCLLADLDWSDGEEERQGDETAIGTNCGWCSESHIQKDGFLSVPARFIDDRRVRLDFSDTLLRVL